MASPAFSVRPLPQAKVPAAEAPRPEKLLGLAVGVVIIAALYLGREVLIPITLAILLSFLLAPLVALLRRLRLPRVPAVLVSVVAALGVILMLGGVIGTQVASLAGNLPRYQTTIEHKVGSVQGLTTRGMDAVMRRLHHAPTAGTANPAAAEAVVAPNGQKAMPVVVQEPTPTPFRLAETVLGPILAPLETLGIVLVVAIFILLQREDLRDRVIRLFGSNDLLRTTETLDDAARRLARYFLTQLGINASFGVLVGIGLTAIGVPNPVLWGVLGALLRFVPYVGSMIAAVLPLALAAAVEPGWSMMIWTGALFLVTETVIGQAVEPLVYGHSTGLSPVAVIVVAIFWSWLWGPIGLILSTPLTLCLVVLGRHVEHLEFLDILLGDRPALTPIESFYQRLLAEDEDHVLRQAETLLKARSLSSYYDDIVLRGLTLAAADVQRGALSHERAQRIDATIKELVHDLDEYEDVDPRPEGSEAGHVPSETVAGLSRDDRKVAVTPTPGEASGEPMPERAARKPEWEGHGPVLCLAGRGPLDEAASAMLAQLLGKHGVGARVAPHHALTRDGLEGVDTRGVALVCLSYLDLSGHPARLRQVMRRLRTQLPGVPLMVGMWPQKGKDGSNVDDALMREQVGAELYAGSLAEAVNQCLELANGSGLVAAIQGAADAAAVREPAA